MQLQTIELRNFCQLQNLSHNFAHGLTGIMGPNGAGKSNTFGAIKFALTGKNDNNGTIADNIYQFAEESDPSYVRLCFKHKESQVEVLRDLRNSSATLQVNGEETTGINNVNRRIAEIIGLDETSLSNLVLIAQDNIFGFLAKQPAQRLDFLQKLLRLDRAKAVHDFVHKQLDNLGPCDHIDSTEIEANLAEAKRDAAEKTRIADEAYAEVYEQDKYERDYKDIVAIYNRQQELLASIQADHARLADAKAAMEKAGTTAESIALRIDEAKTDLASAAGEEASLKAAVDTWRNIQYLQSTRTQLETRLQELLREQTVLSQPLDLPERGEADLEKADARIVELTVEKQACELLLAAADEDLSVCPTCGTKTEAIKESAPAATQRLAEIAEELQAARDWRNETVKCIEARTARAAAIANNEQQIVQQRNAIEQLQFPDEPAVSAEAAGARLNEIVAIRNNLNRLHELKSDSDSCVSFNRGCVQEIESRIAANTKELEQNLRVTKEEFDECNAWLAKRQDSKTRSVTTRHEADAAVSVVRAIERNVEQLAADNHERAVRREWRNRMEAVRDLLHRTAAPRFAVQQGIARLTPAVNEYLERFDADFRVEATQGMTFTAMFSDGRVQPAERLSEGQKVTLALSFCLSLNFTYTPDISFIALDEPTRNLDTRHIRGFEPVFAKLKELSERSGLQCVIITHESALEPLFDDVLTL